MADEKQRRRRGAARQEKATGKITTKRMRTGNILSEDEEDLEYDVEIFETDPAFVRIAHGVTKSIGDFESLRVDVALTVPCYREAIQDTAKNVGNEVSILLETELDEYGIDLRADNK